MNVLLTPGRLSGAVAAIPSKSDAHRALICAALAERPTAILMEGTPSEDMRATARCIEALGGTVRWEAGKAQVTPIGTVRPDPVLDCGESGSTLRFMLPVAAAVAQGFPPWAMGDCPNGPLGSFAPQWKRAAANFRPMSCP